VTTPKRVATSKRVIRRSADYPADWEIADAGALQALVRGEASPAQQQRAINWIIYSASETYQNTFRTDPMESAYAAGKRGVGLQIVKLITLNLSALKDN